jgi:DNA-binding beta-propeller fold protein YncE/4-amino-4-deoxy-L-arabinose transferase-like glycosyltransferase
MTQILGLLLTLLLAFLAQNWLGENALRNGLLLYAVAGAFFVWLTPGPRPWPELPARRAWPKPGWFLAGAGILLTLIATAGSFWQEHYGGWGLVVWGAGVIIFLAGTWIEARDHERNAEPAKTPILQRWQTWALLLILIVAALARFYNLAIYPHGLQSDEANNGLDALKWLQNGRYTPYAETNEGQATLFTWLIALFIKCFGQSIHTLRMVSATVGVLTVAAFYALARECYEHRIALLSTALLAADRWHITFSRIVYELILVPLVLSLQILFLIKALKTGRRRWWALSGAMMALGLNTYTAYRIVPFFMLAWLAWWLLTHHARVRRDLEGILLFAAGALTAVMPLAVYVVHHWSVFISRMNHISVFRDVEAAGSYAPLWQNLSKTLLMFNVHGDAAPLNNLPLAPMLAAGTGVLMVLGLLWALRWARHERPSLYLLWFASIASLAVLSTAHEAPSARRPIGLIPLIYLLVAATLTALLRAWQQAFGKKRTRPLFILFTLFVVIVMAGSLKTYFKVQAVDAGVWYAYSPEESSIGRYLATIPDQTTIFMDPQYSGHAAIKFLAGNKTITPLNLIQDIPLRQPPANDALFILEPKDQLVLSLLQDLYPTGQQQLHKDRFGRLLFLSYHIPATAFAEAQGLTASYIAGSDPAQPPVRQEKITNLDLDFTTPEQQPLLPPFVARYQSALLITTPGNYHLALTAQGGQATLLLDDEPILTAQDETAQTSLLLAGGFQALTLIFQASAHPQQVRLDWSSPRQPDLHPVPAQHFYALKNASNGLLGTYFATPDWQGDPILVQRDLFITPNEAIISPYSVQWIGQVAAPVEGSYIFGTRSDDGSFLLIDGQLVVDNGGLHGAEYREGSIVLTRGWHDIEVKYSDNGGSRAMELWWQPPASAKNLLPSTYLRPGKNMTHDDLPPMPIASAPAPSASPNASAPLAGPRPGPKAPDDALLPEMGEFPMIQPPLLWTFGSCGSGKTGLMHPAGVAISDDGHVYVADTGNHRIVQLDAHGQFVQAWGKAGDAPGHLDEVFDLAITPAGELASLDAANQRISLWQLDGTHVRDLAAGLGLYHPRGLTVTSAGDFYIADTGGGKILHLDADGNLLNALDATAHIGGGQPTDVVVNEATGMIYVAEPASGLLLIIAADNQELAAAPGPRSNTVESPHIATLPDDSVLFTDPEKGRVLIFDAGLHAMVQFGGQGTGEGHFSRTLGIASAADLVVITDPDLCRVTAFGF